ncbi:hypothetical protein SS50377_26956 [Spironucleus salmonicida]|uniref:Uncharacterized protein n=1 Tax=Spironucleus salmonicida TaxID=348837 RepID=V6LS32_9EUKA|nr:hypothetical protein SS50377_26956 [Spironucleus salmonicida]|eukprot:EST47467.1 Hypothetical protein SS50377_12452 [Spironucleus salmonicida]
MLQIILISVVFVIAIVASIYFAIRIPPNYILTTSSHSKPVLDSVKIFNSRNYAPISVQAPEFIVFTDISNKDIKYKFYQTDSPLAPILVIQPNFSISILDPVKKLAVTSGRSVYALLGGYEFSTDQIIKELEVMLDIINKPTFLVTYGTGSNRILQAIQQQRFGSVIKIFACYCSFDALAPMFWSTKVITQQNLVIQNWLKLNGQNLVNSQQISAFELKNIVKSTNIQVGFDTLISRNLETNVEEYYMQNCQFDKLDTIQNEVVFINSNSDQRTGRIFPDHGNLVKINYGEYMKCYVRGSSDVVSILISLLIQDQ